MAYKFDINTVNSTYAPFVQSNSKGSQLSVPSMHIEDFYTPSDNKKRKGKGLVIALTSTVGITLAGVATFLVFNPNVKAMNKFSNKLINIINDEIVGLKKKQKVNKHLTMLESSMLKASNASRKFLLSIRGFANFTPIKDVSASRLFKKIGVDKKANSITDLFRNVTVKTTKGKYKTAKANYAKVDDVANRIANIFEEQYGEKELAGSIRAKTADIKSEVLKFVQEFDEKPVAGGITRLQDAQDRIEPVRQEFIDLMKSLKKEHKGIKELKDFLPEKILKDSKEEFVEGINNSRRSITNSIYDNYTRINSSLDEVGILISPDNVEARKALKAVRTSLKEYKNLKGVENIERRAEIAKGIQKEIKGVSKHLGSENEDAANALLKTASNVLQNDKKGELQDLILMCKKINDKNPKIYNEFKQARIDFVKSFDKAVDSESNKLFDKMRDLHLGAAPTDVLALSTPTALIGYSMIKADNANERVEAGLTVGVPAIGAVSMMILGTVIQLSGPAALATSTGVGFALNKLGAFINSKYQAFAAKK